MINTMGAPASSSLADSSSHSDLAHIDECVYEKNYFGDYPEGMTRQDRVVY